MPVRKMPRPRRSGRSSNTAGEPQYYATTGPIPELLAKDDPERIAAALILRRTVLDAEGVNVSRLEQQDALAFLHSPDLMIWADLLDLDRASVAYRVRLLEQRIAAAASPQIPPPLPG